MYFLLHSSLTILILILAQAITTRVLSSPFFHQCKSVSCYLSMPSGEVDTSSLVSHILRAGTPSKCTFICLPINLCPPMQGKTLFVPRITGDHMDFFKVGGDEDLMSFPSGIWGIKEPSLEYHGQKRQSGI
jgi:5-formyltetrahydrofolate cyclo-ligase